MERIHVSVRARPLSPDDAKSSPWRISGNCIFMPNHSSNKFEFDRIFDEDCRTGEVYEARTRDIVAAAVQGFNGTVFAYGQTSSGKTHTMRGLASEPGIIPLSVQDLFETIQQDVEREFLLRMSYMEIYNEEINDLLAPAHKKLQIHENLERGIYVAGLREEIVVSPEQVTDLMAFGEAHRHIGETNMNLYSSRSHTIFRMIIESRDRNEDEAGGSSCDAVRVSVLNLVDLAGSERVSKTGAEGIRFKEGSHINKSLLTLGTVIKKLSEGTESQGGHVPYRDSKLTRILQPALGGNANTAIICTITLAQIHADETKSSLQFASRALRVTNCAQVNEILTDAALLKRQKKEIEELREKLQASHSEHLEEEILNLRNKLLQIELERERIALELEEGKKAQAEREKRLQEQAKRIENLSSMVLYSNREEKRDHVKKEKRRDTWCPGSLLRPTTTEAASVHARDSIGYPTRSKHNVKPLLPFEELVEESEIGGDESCRPPKRDRKTESDDIPLPDPGVLLHVTTRRKLPPKKKSLPVEDKKLAELQAEYEELFLKYETERIMNEVQMDCLLRKLGQSEIVGNLNVHNSRYDDDHRTIFGEKAVSLRESEAILVIKQLQEQIKMLEMEKSSNQENLDSVLELATEQNRCAMEKFGELSEELCNAREEAKLARELLPTSKQVDKIDENFDYLNKLSNEVQDIISVGKEVVKAVENSSLLLDEIFQSFSSLKHEFLDIKSLMSDSSIQQRSVVSDHERLHCHMTQELLELQKHKEELKLEAEKKENSLMELLEQHNQEKFEFASHIEYLENEIASLSSSFLAREKETLRKDLEKTKAKLMDIEFKYKTSIKEKTKLEGEKAFAERELKRLHGQKALLERDISKRDSLASKKRESTADRSSRVFDPRKAKSVAVPADQTMQEEHRKLEVLVFELEATIASLEQELAVACSEKEEAVSISENLSSELEVLSEKYNASTFEFSALQEEVSGLKSKLEEYESSRIELESCIRKLEEEKENLAMQLTDSLLKMEEEKAIWSAKENACNKAIEERTKMDNAEIMLLSKAMSEVRNELETCQKHCTVLEEKLACSEETAEWEKKCSDEKSVEIDQLKNKLEITVSESIQSQEVLKSNSEKLSSELQSTCEKLGMLQKELDFLKNEREELSIRIREMESEEKSSNTNTQLTNKVEVEELTRKLSSMEVEMHKYKVTTNKEMAKLKLQLRGEYKRAEAFLFRYREEMAEKDYMDKNYKETSKKLKEDLALYIEKVLDLNKELVATRSQCKK